jgi:sortase (surface protein transpeptidase)
MYRALASAREGGSVDRGVHSGSYGMAKLAAALAAAVIGATLGVGLVIVLGQNGLPQPAIPASLSTTAPTSEPSEPADSFQPARPSDTSSPEREPVPKPVRVVIPAIDVDAELVGLGIHDDGSMEVPNFGLAGWYEPGPRPGEPGPAVIAAHVDSVRGPDVFFRLRDLTAGDKITVEQADGRKTTFRVQRSEQQLKEELPAKRIWNDTDEVVLRLITCGGDFDPNERSYRSNVIVYAKAV